jgi:Ala-tRNA(Pro) deacylase
LADAAVDREGAVRPRSLDKFLRDACVPYTTFTHPERFTAQHEAAVSHVPGGSWAKVVICLADDELIAAVVPAPSFVDLEQLRVLAGARALRLAAEDELRTLCTDCELGAMPPFGFNGRFPHRVFVDGSLVGEPEMVFNAGTHIDAIRMHYRDFADLVHPLVGAIGCRSTPGATLVRRVGEAECA